MSDGRSVVTPVARIHTVWILIATALAAVDGMDTAGVAVANPVIARDLHADLAQLQWLTNGFLLAMAICVLGAGRVADRFGQKRVFLIGIAGFAVASALVAFAPSIELMIAARVLQGIFGAVLMPTSLAILRHNFPAAQLKTVVGIWGGLFSAVTAVTPLLAGAIIEALNWRWWFLFKVLVGVVAFALAAWAVPGGVADKRPQTLDLLGVVLLGGAMGGLVWGAMQVPGSGWDRPVVLVPIALFVVCLVLFVVHAGRSTEPLLPLRLFRSAPFSSAAAIVLFMGMASFGAIFYLSLYLQQVLHLSPQQTGLMLTAVTGLFIVSGPLGGLLNRRYDASVPILGGLVLNGIAMVGLSRVSVNSQLDTIWPWLLLFGLGLGFVMPQATEVIISNAPSEQAGVAGAVQHTSGLLGTALGTAVFGTIVSWRIASISTDPDVPADTAREALAFTEGLRLAILTALGLLVLSMVCAVVIRRKSAPTEPAPEVTGVPQMTT